MSIAETTAQMVHLEISEEIKCEKFRYVTAYGALWEVRGYPTETRGIQGLKYVEEAVYSV